MARRVFWVSPSGSKWTIKEQGSAVILYTYDTKESAVIFASTYAKGYQPSQVKIQLADGTIEKEYTYGDDPFPPKG
jgi:hypothetical protein